MSELTDDQLDGLFRKSAEEFDTPYDPAAWQDMKNRLDTHDQTRPGGSVIWKKLLRWGLPLGLLLLITAGGWYAYRNGQPMGIRTVKSTRTTPELTTITVRARQPERSQLAPGDQPNQPTVHSPGAD